MKAHVCRGSVAVVCLSVFASFAAVVWAEPASREAGWVRLTTEFSNDRICGPVEWDPTAKEVHACLVQPQAGVTNLNIRSNVVVAIGIVLADAEARWKDAPDGSPESRILRIVRHAARHAPNAEVTDAQWGQELWGIDSTPKDLDWNPLQEPTRISFRAILDDPATAPADAYSRTVAALRISELTARCVAYLRLQKTLDALKDVQMKKTMREEYLFGGIPQWPWELLINGMSSGCCARVFATKWDGYGQRPPPRGQWIFAHPDVAMEYMDQAPRGQELKPALSVEVLGFDLWDWEKDGKQTGPLFGWAVGAGVVANLSDRDGDANWGWGGVVHLDRSYNVGVVFYDGDPAFFVSANVGKKLLKATKLYGKYVK